MNERPILRICYKNKDHSTGNSGCLPNLFFSMDWITIFNSGKYVVVAGGCQDVGLS